MVSDVLVCVAQTAGSACARPTEHVAELDYVRPASRCIAGLQCDHSLIRQPSIHARLWSPAHAKRSETKATEGYCRPRMNGFQRRMVPSAPNGLPPCMYPSTPNLLFAKRPRLCHFLRASRHVLHQYPSHYASPPLPFPPSRSQPPFRPPSFSIRMLHSIPLPHLCPTYLLARTFDRVIFYSSRCSRTQCPYKYGTISRRCRCVLEKTLSASFLTPATFEHSTTVSFSSDFPLSVSFSSFFALAPSSTLVPSTAFAPLVSRLSLSFASSLLRATRSRNLMGPLAYLDGEGDGYGYSNVKVDV